MINHDHFMIMLITTTLHFIMITFPMRNKQHVMFKRIIIMIIKLLLVGAKLMSCEAICMSASGS